MKHERRSIKNTSSAEEREKEKQLRDTFQKERPTLQQLLATGDYSEPMPQATVFEQLQLAAKLKSLRESARLSLTEMASRTGMDKAALSRLESGQTDNPTFATLDRYLRALGKQMRIEFEDAAH